MTIQVIEMDDIVDNPDLMAITRSLTLGGFSGMNQALDFYTRIRHERSIKAKGIYACVNDLKVGWALFTYESDAYNFLNKDGHACVQIYVSWKYRRRGIGAKLIRKAEELAKDSVLCVYSYNNPQFFAPFMAQPNFTSL